MKKRKDKAVERQRNKIEDVLNDFYEALLINHPCIPISQLEAEMNNIRNAVMKENDDYLQGTCGLKIKKYIPKK